MTEHRFFPEPPVAAPGRIAGRVVMIASGQLYVVREGDRLRLPLTDRDPLPEFSEPLIIGRFGPQPCLAVEYTGELPAACELRRALYELPELERVAVGRALELLFWRRKQQFCGSCGAPLEDAVGECARKCPRCGALFFPVLAPAVIVAVTRGRELLLAHNARFTAGMYSLIAGFVEPGEQAEQAVRRELREEVNLEIRNLRYFGSQCWPYPNSLMLGFFAEYAGGEVEPDGVEILDARFYPVERFPRLPEFGSIARTMIEHFRAAVGAPAEPDAAAAPPGNR